MEPVIKVRHKWRLYTMATLLALAALAVPADASYTRCNKAPIESTVPKEAGSNGFRVNIIGEPRLYRPNQMYKIQLGVSVTWSDLYSFNLSHYYLF